MSKAQYDAQGNYWHHLTKVAGWDQKRVEALLLKRFQATHWLALDDKERREAINIMKGYAAKAEKSRATKLRHDICALVAANCHTVDWLHDCMEAWGFGRSLRALNYYNTVQVYESLKTCFFQGGIDA